ncbi:MAG: hypothetical protein QME16_07835 [Planctomycetota bacterium]|nr:hypothetical protein [Planctomycetota bacterium]
MSQRDEEALQMMGVLSNTVAPLSIGSSPLEKGGIDLSNIELAFKDESFISSPLINPADRKILLSAKALKQGFMPLSLLRAYEAIGLFNDKIVKEVQNKELLTQVLNWLNFRAGDLINNQLLQFSDSPHPDTLFVKP